MPLEQLDITNTDRVKTYLDDTNPGAVVNCAAMTDVDGCESNPERATAVNADAPERIAQWCAANGCQFAHVSTDYVFDGRAEAPYDESAAPNPVQAYGRSKLSGEYDVRETMALPLLARLSFVWGVHRGDDELQGFPRWVRDSLRDGDETPLFTDQRVTPTRAGQAAAVLLDLLERGVSGTYHVAARSCVTPYEFGEAIRDRSASATGTLRRSSMADIDRPAERPAYTCLDLGKVEDERNESQLTLDEDLDAVSEYF
jgi:dTDP-4-dehydrorhamnose reductase